MTDPRAKYLPIETNIRKKMCIVSFERARFTILHPLFVLRSYIRKRAIIRSETWCKYAHEHDNYGGIFALLAARICCSSAIRHEFDVASSFNPFRVLTASAHCYNLTHLVAN